MDRRSTPRRKGDELLLAAGGDGWVPRDDLVRHMMQFVMPGQAHRLAAKSRKTDNDPRQRDTVRVGSRMKALDTMSMAVKTGAWIREGAMVRHRDWQGEAAPVASPEAGFAVPTMDEVRHHAALTGFTKWHWAAVVACYVVEYEKHDNQHEVAKSSNLTATDFAALGIAALSSKDTVRKYLHIWLEHSGGVRPEPGEAVEIPSMDTWPTKRTRKRERPVVDPTPRTRPWHQRLVETSDPVEAAALIRKHTKIPDEIGRELVRQAAPAPVTHLRAVN